MAGVAVCNFWAVNIEPLNAWYARQGDFVRLTGYQIEAIRAEVARAFGDAAVVRLFGSRVDDAARGGDIDLHIESEGTPSDLLDRELRLRACLMRRLGDRRIDVVVQSRGRPLCPIDEQANRTGVAL